VQFIDVDYCSNTIYLEHYNINGLHIAFPDSAMLQPVVVHPPLVNNICFFLSKASLKFMYFGPSNNPVVIMPCFPLLSFPCAGHVCILLPATVRVSAQLPFSLLSMIPSKDLISDFGFHPFATMYCTFKNDNY
jgi:hypothetical protein